MPHFEATEKNAPATAEAKPGLKPYQVPVGLCAYHGIPHRYTAVLDTSQSFTGWGKERGEMKATDLVRPGVWDLMELRAWDEIDVTYGPNPSEAWSIRLRVIAAKRGAVLRHERDAGMVARHHTVVAIVHAASQATPVWGDEPPETTKAVKAA